MQNRFQIFSLVLIGLLSFALAVSLTFILTQTSQIKTSEKNGVREGARDVHIGGYKRMFVLENIDTERNVIGARVLSNDPIVGQRRIVFQINEDTLIERQDPIFNDSGAIVRFENTAALSLSDLEVGMEVFARVFVENNGSITATAIVTGSPFVRP